MFNSVEKKLEEATVFQTIKFKYPRFFVLRLSFYFVVYFYYVFRVKIKHVKIKLLKIINSTF